jgi:hypothetical protein
MGVRCPGCRTQIYAGLICRSQGFWQRTHPLESTDQFDPELPGLELQLLPFEALSMNVLSWYGPLGPLCLQGDIFSPDILIEKFTYHTIHSWPCTAPGFSIFRVQQPSAQFFFFFIFLLLFICACKAWFVSPPPLTTHSAPSLSPPQYPAETILPLFLILL